MRKIRLGIVGYGNLGRGVERAIAHHPDMELVAVFTRRNPDDLSTEVDKVHLSEIERYKDQIDVMILCGGSATDLPEQGPEMAAMFHTVDSYDTHAKIPQYFAAVDEAAKQGGNISVISTGWDPGLFSLNRLLAEAILPQGKPYTFWGKGLSQGHSDAVRRVKGVKNGVQYTIPNEAAVAKVRSGEQPELETKDRHIRECFIVPEPGEDLARIKTDIETMPNYFAEYETIVHFISDEELQRDHASMPHGGHVLRSAETGDGHKQTMEFSLRLGHNPEFTSSVLVAYARAVFKYAQEGVTGAKTPFDVPFGYLSPKSPEQLRKELL